jgi:2-(1,2-epoxy-1,2-dihydrophenyl)acetyl-CoA isomerase
LAADLVPAAEVPAAAAALAAKLAAGPTAAYAETKRLLAESPARPLAQSLEAESAAQHRLSLTADHAGAVRAFLAREKPAFRGI